MGCAENRIDKDIDSDEVMSSTEQGKTSYYFSDVVIFAKNHALKIQEESRYIGFLMPELTRLEDVTDGVQYYSLEKRQQIEVDVDTVGRVKWADGNFLADGRYLYIMTELGAIRMVRDGQAGARPLHSQLSAGEPVAAGGTIEIVQGKIRLISNATGHYRIPGFGVEQILYELHARGVSIAVKVAESKLIGRRLQVNNSLRRTDVVNADIRTPTAIYKALHFGQTRQSYGDGSSLQNDQGIYQLISKDGEVLNTFPNNLKEVHWGNGIIETFDQQNNRRGLRFVEGKKQIQPDGTIVIEAINGAIAWLNTDGSFQIQLKDGEQIKVDRNRVILRKTKNEQYISYFPDGTQRVDADRSVDFRTPPPLRDMNRDVRLPDIKNELPREKNVSQDPMRREAPTRGRVKK